MHLLVTVVLAVVTVANWQLNAPWFHVIPQVNYTQTSIRCGLKDNFA